MHLPSGGMKIAPASLLSMQATPIEALSLPYGAEIDCGTCVVRHFRKWLIKTGRPLMILLRALSASGARK